MGISNTTKITCDYIHNEKPCGKTFYLPDDPTQNTPGVENTVSVTNALGQVTYFCSRLHAIGSLVAQEKAVPVEEKSIKQTEPKIVKPTKTQIESLAAVGIISDNLKLKDEDVGF